MRKLTLVLAAIIALAILTPAAYAHYSGYAACNDNGRIIYTFNDNLWSKYAEFSRDAKGAWNNEKQQTNSQNWCFMDNKTSNNTATVNVGGCSGCHGAIAYFEHWPGPQQDKIRYDQQWLNQNASVFLQHKIVNHEWGHSGGLAHNNAACDTTIMRAGDNVCSPGAQQINYPGSHDQQDVNNVPRYWNANTYRLGVDEPTVVEREKDGGKLASKTVAYPGGGYRVLEYPPAFK